MEGGKLGIRNVILRVRFRGTKLIPHTNLSIETAETAYMAPLRRLKDRALSQIRWT